MTDFRDKLRNPDCTLCPLHEGAEWVCLMGSGPKRARIMIVGEAPGQREDETHKAFVGSSGKLLNKALADYAQIDREECYVTNVVKCRPPDNRTPELKEIKMCVSAYFEREVEKVRPEFILLLGNAALRGVTKKSGITKQAGTPWKMVIGGQKLTVFAALHPAGVLRNPKHAEGWLRDLEMFGKLTRSEKVGDRTAMKMITKPAHLKWLLQQLDEAEEISWDIETFTEPGQAPQKHTHFQDYRGDGSHIVSIAFSWEEGQAAFLPLWHPQSPWRHKELEVLERLETVMNRPDKKYIGHNGKFDARWFHTKGIPVPQTFDTMLAAHMLEENRAKGLKPLSRSILRQPGYDVGEELANAPAIPIKRLGVYNSKDADYTLRLYHVFRRQLIKDLPTAKLFKYLMMPASEALVDVERAGVYIDQERWEERHDKAQENVEKIYKYINKMVPSTLAPINLNSPPQVAQWLFGHLGLPVIEETDKGAKSTKESVLLQLLADEPNKGIEALMKYRKWAKFLSTYLLPWKFEHMDVNGRIHSNYKLFGTVTGRLSGEGGIQQVPRDPFIRSIIGSRPGWKFVSADYSQIELRIAAMVSEDKKLLAQYQRGEDVHMLRAMKMTGKPAKRVEKEERKKAKAVNFGYVYGMGENKFITYAFENYDVRVTPEEAHTDREGFFEDYPALRVWHERQRRLARRYRMVRSPLGRIRHLPDIGSSTESVRQEAERQAINSPVQATASDLMLMSLVELHRLLDPKHGFVVGTVHDSILFEIRDEYVDEYAEIIKTTMEDVDRVRRMYECEITVPIVADIEVGTHWGEGKEWAS
jgi:uracil-DNA glycosylase family 4